LKKDVTLENMFEKEQTKSILNLLIEFKEEGLRHLYILYAINPDKFKKQKNKKESNRNIDRMKFFFDIKLEELYKKQQVIRGCINTKETLMHYLRKLKKLNVIELIGEKHKNKKYKINENVYRIGLRLQNKESLDFFPPEKINYFNIKAKNIFNKEYIKRKVIIYGLSEENLKNKSEEKKHIDNLLNEIDIVFEIILNKKFELWKKENKKRLRNFIDTTKNDRIKKFLKEKNIGVLGVFSSLIDFSKYEKNQIDLLKSKKHFFSQFKYGIPIENLNKTLDKENIDFIEDLKRLIDDLNDVEYSKSWCKTFFHKEYNLTRMDIYEIIEWVWDNKDFFDEYFPMDLALSVYGSYSDNNLTKLIK